MIANYAVDIFVVVACAEIVRANRACRQSRIGSCNQVSCILEIHISTHPFANSVHGTPFKLSLIAKVGRVKSILPTNPEPPLVPPPYRPLLGCLVLSYVRGR